MDKYQFIGYLVMGLTALVGLFVAVFVPLMKIVSRLTSMEAKLDAINDTLKGHEKRLDAHENKLGVHDTEIAILKGKGGK